MSKIDNTVELFKSHGLITWDHYRYVWSRKAHDLAKKNNCSIKNYSIKTDFTYNSIHYNPIWLYTGDDAYGFRWILEDDEKYDEYVKMTLEVFDIIAEDDIVPIDVEDIVL